LLNKRISIKEFNVDFFSKEEEKNWKLCFLLHKNLSCVNAFHKEEFFDMHKMNNKFIIKQIQNKEDNHSIIKKED